MSLYDALKAEADARDAALWREWWPRLSVLGTALIDAIEKGKSVSLNLSTFKGALASAREAAGKEARNG